MERKLRTCAVCKTSYPYCPKCDEDKDKEIWYFTFCSKNCKDIYNITSDFEDNHTTAKEANEKLKTFDLSKLNDFGTSYKSSINKIMESVTVVEEVKIQNIENIETISELDNQFEVTGSIEDDTDIEKSIKKPRNRKAKNVEE
ncbi:MAG: hypothetical protein IJA10_10300 [Lachnospiraceae bacterium]|nr:hypothetical protein [Lachnospiraceae bacterium]